MKMKKANLGKMEFNIIVDKYEEEGYCADSRYIMGQRKEDNRIFFLNIEQPYYCIDLCYLRFYELDEIIGGCKTTKYNHIEYFLGKGEPDIPRFKSIDVGPYGVITDEEYSSLSEVDKKAFRNAEHEKYNVNEKMISYSLDEILDKALEEFSEIVEWVPTRKSRSGKTLYASYPSGGHQLPQVGNRGGKSPSQLTKEVAESQKDYIYNYYNAANFVEEFALVMLWVKNNKSDYPLKELMPLMELLVKYDKIQTKAAEALSYCNWIVENRKAKLGKRKEGK